MTDMFDIPSSWSPLEWLLAALAVLILGVAKAGFGGGLGLLGTIFMVKIVGAQTAVGAMLPILVAIDLFSLRHYWRDWNRRAVLLLMPGTVAGIVVGSLLLGVLNDQWLRLIIGLIAVLFVLHHVWKARGGAPPKFHPGWASGTGFGAAAGVSSTLAHAAGPVATMFLLPQQMTKTRFVGTTVVYFALVNGCKLPFYFGTGTITYSTLGISLALVALVPLGVALGIFLHHRINETWFNRFIYFALLVAGLNLIVRSSIALAG